MNIKNAADLKRLHLDLNQESKFFDRDSMKFFGDTMGNYACSANTVEVETYSGDTHQCYELRRKKPVKHGLQSSAYFDSVTLRKVHSKD